VKEKGISLIGMPASGKSTVGRELARRTRYELLDVDRWIERQMGGLQLAEIIETHGPQRILELETKCIMGRDFYDTIVSTPGSIVYNDVYDHLSDQTLIVWLNVSAPTIEHRLNVNSEHRRLIIGLAQKGLQGLMNERVPLYEQWAHHTIDCDGKTVDDISTEIVEALGRVAKT
jgi:shikimate kinase